MPGSPRKTYRTHEIAVTFEPRLCIHSAVCLRELPAVFDVNARPWIAPGNGDAEAIAAAVRLCPSGALTYTQREGEVEVPETPDPQASIQPRTNGPVLVRGDLEIKGEDGTVLRRATRAALCRCGASKNTPFCDNSHRAVGFRSEA